MTMQTGYHPSILESFAWKFLGESVSWVLERALYDSRNGKWVTVVLGTIDREGKVYRAGIPAIRRAPGNPPNSNHLAGDIPPSKKYYDDLEEAMSAVEITVGSRYL